MSMLWLVWGAGIWSGALAYMSSSCQAPFPYTLTAVAVASDNAMVAATSVFAVVASRSTNAPCEEGPDDQYLCGWKVTFQMLPGPRSVLTNWPQPWVVYVGGANLAIQEVWVDGLKLNFTQTFTELQVVAVGFMARVAPRSVNLSVAFIGETQILPPLVYNGPPMRLATDDYEYVIKVVLWVSVSLAVAALLAWQARSSTAMS